MPKRTRSHELESKSFVKFESLIPSRWVFRRKTPDYGIDGEIEIFDDEGKATGLFINIQLKSTDAEIISGCLKESFQVETLKYYSSIEYPVLISKYSSSSDKFYFTWAHAKNRTPVEKGQKTVTIHLPENNILTTATFFQLKDDVINYLNYRKQALRPPFKLRLFVDYSGFRKSDYLLKLKQHEAHHDAHISVCKPEDKDAIGKIVITRECVILSIGGDSASFKTPLPDSTDVLLANLNMSLAILLSHIGYDILSAKLATPVYKISSFFAKPDQLKYLLSIFYDAKEYGTVFEACRWAINEQKYVDEVLIFSARLYRHYNHVSREEQILVEKLFLFLNQHFFEMKDELRLSTSHYNLGNFYRSIGEHLRSLGHYNKARKINPVYMEKNYFWRELGGVLFDSDKITCANHAYKKSLAIKEEFDVRALYADTFVYMGLYSVAKKEFEKYLEKTESEQKHGFWCLKLNALTGLFKHFALKDGKRDRKASDKIIIAQLETSLQKITIEEARQLDPTNSFAWFQLGHIYFKEGNFEKSFWAYLWTAVCSDKNLEAWAYAFFLVFNRPGSGDTAMLFHIFMAAYKRNGEQFISYLFDFISNNIKLEKEKREELKEVILSMVDHAGSLHENEFTLRVFP